MAFEAVQRVATIMHGFARPWYVAGGWALDLFLGRETRAHEDVEVAIFRRDQEALWRHLSGWVLEQIVASKRRSWRGEWLAPPIHEIHGRPVGGDADELEVLLDEAWAGTWRFRRNLAVMRPVGELGLRTAEGVPFLVPEIVLLYKAKNPRPQDAQDFRTGLSALDERRRQWLADALRVCHPDHPWLTSLPPAGRQSS